MFKNSRPSHCVTDDMVFFRGATHEDIQKNVYLSGKFLWSCTTCGEDEWKDYPPSRDDISMSARS